MSTLKTHNLQSPDAGSVNIALAPNTGMVVAGLSTFSATGIDIGADTNINRPSAGVLGFNINSSEKVRITSEGKVGIGTNILGATRVDVFEPTGSNSNRSLVRFQKDHTSTSVTGSTGAVDQYPHALILENQDNSADTGTVSLAFSKYSSGVQSQAIIAGIQESAGNMALTLNTESSNTIGERLRIASDGTKEFKNHGGGTLKIGGSSAHTSKIVIADNGGTANGNCLVEGGDGTDFFTIQSNGNVAFTNGRGINFAATGDASGMDNELLDDYEEGSWTPTARNDGSFTSSLGRYVKIGQQVTVWGFIPLVTNNTSNNTLQVSGLPFTVASGGCTEYVGTLMIRFVTSVSGVNGVSFNTYTYSGRNYLEFFACRDDGNNYESIKHSDLHYTNSNGIRFCITYVV